MKKLNLFFKKYHLLIIIVIMVLILSLANFFPKSFKQLHNKLIHSWIFWVICIIGWILECNQFAKRSGWKTLAEHFSNIPYGLNKKFNTLTGIIGKYTYRGMLRVSFEDKGLLLKVLWLFSFGHKKIFIQWYDISKIIIKGILELEGNKNIISRILLKGSEKKFAELKLKKMPRAIVILPWNSEFQNKVPKNIKVEIV